MTTMLYINEQSMCKMDFLWKNSIDVIESTLECISMKKYAQPLKPYLRFGNKVNRIIAMPAYIGGSIESAGIKWIASFPQNVLLDIPRASCVTILNDVETGIPLAIFNTALVSIIRTVSVSGYILGKYVDFKKKRKYNIGILGWGPIGRNHYNMCKEILKNAINEVYVYDKRTIDIKENRIKQSKNWKEVYDNADIFISCTSSLERYINAVTNSDKLVLDVSLRDFQYEALECFSRPFIVDDWNEVNREDTDIEYYAKLGGICENDVINLCDIYKKNLNDYFEKKDTIFFAPMGMATFDIAIANYFYKRAIEEKIGIQLD